jgi:hypothetical protein
MLKRRVWLGTSCSFKSAVSPLLRDVGRNKIEGPPGQIEAMVARASAAQKYAYPIGSSSLIPASPHSTTSFKGKERSSTKYRRNVKTTTSQILESATQILRHDLINSSCSNSISSLHNSAIRCGATIRNSNWIGNLKSYTTTEKEGCHSIQ